MKNKLPRSVQWFGRSFPKVWVQFRRLGEECHRAGPLEPRVRRLIKVGIAAAAQSEGAVHSAVRHARGAGLSAAEIRHAVLLAITTVGFPRAMAALSWANDTLRRK